MEAPWCPRLRSRDGERRRHVYVKVVALGQIALASPYAVGKKNQCGPRSLAGPPTWAYMVFSAQMFVWYTFPPQSISNKNAKISSAKIALQHYCSTFSTPQQILIFHMPKIAHTKTHAPRPTLVSGAQHLQRAIALLSACVKFFCMRTTLQHLLERLRRVKKTVFNARSSF